MARGVYEVSDMINDVENNDYVDGEQSFQINERVTQTTFSLGKELDDVRLAIGEVNIICNINEDEGGDELDDDSEDMSGNEDSEDEPKFEDIDDDSNDEDESMLSDHSSNE
ncbi:coiled-coil domain-containing protein 1-like [Cynara cardunculus var. scolymus]|uniref:coiled-coil domain-containing protein 1-like n=1 Tax=Cynara cardunculus var. scolymus TaxID=59895 RepID=UPI000D62B5CC|nr:coiled-coil domain-containing protein 1-like [Cynara cardunculus var. scolymus]